MSHDEERRRSFDGFAERYDRARPSYPDAIVAQLAARVPGRRAVEIGAGTGKATAVLARHGFSVVALEPGVHLAALLRARGLPGVTVVETTFEDWDGADGSYDVVVAAQSIHWTRPEVRYAKSAAALGPGGAIAWLRNEKGALDPGLRAELDAAYARWFPEVAGRGADEVLRSRRENAADIEASGRFGPVDILETRWTQRYATAEYLELLDTYSEHALLEPARKRPLYEAIAAALDRRGGIIEIPYVTLLFLAHRRM